MSVIQQTASLDIEQEYFSEGVQLIVGMDEVGRGSLAGPVGVGVALLSAQQHHIVEGLTDSKALSAKKREALVPIIKNWCATGLGYSSAQEIDAMGMTLALRLAGQRALSQALLDPRVSSFPSQILLDGSHNWFTPHPPDLLSALDEAHQLYQELADENWNEHVASKYPNQQPWNIPVTTIVKGDYRCACIAAASVIAKVHRDHLMEKLAQENTSYGWDKNKGYGSKAHREALAAYGASAHHRLSWNLGLEPQQLKEAYIQRMVETL
ncbi:ribonuclease HII [Rothia sp. P7181]|uniref:ribonuclease HII n=1 Tax=unclassified Rothia (in: high G+C Gram-positive bacteria) TaxID=2689056 RepID=UPI003AE8EF83